MSTLRILYRDDALCAVLKPSGLAVHRGWARERDTAAHRLGQQLGAQVFAVHRLDRGTSGVLLFALNADAARIVQESRDAGRTQRSYLALVRGPAKACDNIDHAIPRRAGGPRVPAQTDYRSLGNFERYSLVLAQPHTGRLHQVRRHLKHVSLPIIGDTKYGKSEHNRLLSDRVGLSRLALHALSLALPHPLTGNPLELLSPLPNDLAQPLIAMGFGAQLAELGALDAPDATGALDAPDATGALDAPDRPPKARCPGSTS
ncbi:MAG TPA: pseudouridine synthase [Polyangiaceae bacterium]|nr:pseudouridine synthase [Polyangiaceae bacterium]